MTRGFVIAAPASGAGKSTVTIGLLRAFRKAGIAAAAAKCGPDYIDPMYHAVAVGGASVNLDPWAMSPGLLAGLAATQGAAAELLVVEGVMGLFDGARDGKGSTADLAATLGLPIILLVDASHQAQSLAAIVHGFNTYRPDTRIAGVIFNHVGAPSHAGMIRAALSPLGVPVIGAIPRRQDFAIPSRHLGLAPPAEIAGVEARIEALAEAVATDVDLAALQSLAQPLSQPPARDGGGDESGGEDAPTTLPPPGQHIAVADDIAFCFAYPHLLDGWRRQGATLSLFSPLADAGPAADADTVYLPGGYPELHVARLAGNDGFRDGMAAAAARGALIYGECGGYMVLGEGLTDAEGQRRRMLGLLPLETSFAERKLHLGYRRLTPTGHAPWPGARMGHEFHYASVLKEAGADPLFSAEAADGLALAPMGLQCGNIMGSFAHVIA